MAINCFGCGDVGHIEADCPRAGMDGTRKPPWCGICDERTRRLDLGDSMARCQVCHPLARKQLKQHRKCPHCHVTVCEWDNAPCGSHSGPAVPDRRPERKRIEQIVAAP